MSEKPKFSRLESHRKWLRSYESTILHQAESYLAEQLESKTPVRSFVRELLRRPAWALTEDEAEQRREAEESELIDFATSLDFNDLMEQLETRGEPEAQPETKTEPQSLPPSLPIPPSGANTSNFFSFPCEPVGDAITITPGTCDRHVVISSDVVRNMPHSVSNLPYLRLCPSV